MNVKIGFLKLFIAVLLAAGTVSHARTINFSGYTWNVRPAGTGGPGPNQWDPNNVWVDGQGCLHLQLSHRNGRWYCAEVSTQSRLGFGRYQFWVIGRVDELDKNVVFGLFNYPTADVGPDGTSEIDMEFAKWGDSLARAGNFTVWPATDSVGPVTRTFRVALTGDRSTHRFTWNPVSVFFQSQHGHYDDNSLQFASWIYQPADPAKFIARKPMPVHINLWCHDGHPPSNGQPVELVVRAFKFTPK